MKQAPGLFYLVRRCCTSVDRSLTQLIDVVPADAMI